MNSLLGAFESTEVFRSQISWLLMFPSWFVASLLFDLSPAFLNRHFFILFHVSHLTRTIARGGEVLMEGTEKGRRAFRCNCERLGDMVARGIKTQGTLFMGPSRSHWSSFPGCRDYRWWEIEAQLVTMQISHVLLQDTMVERVRHIRKYEHRRAETATSLTLHVGHGFGVNTSRYLVMNPFWASVKTWGAWFFVSLVMRSQGPLKEWKSNWISFDSVWIQALTSRLYNLSGTAILPDAQNPQTWKRDANPQKFSGLKTYHGLL